MENYKNNTLIENFDKDYYSIKELKKTKNKKLKKFYNTLINNKLFLNYYNQCKSISKIIEAGYFTEKYPFQKYFENIFTTPFNKLNLKKDKVNYVLLSTGGFAPIHNGHINLLEESKLYLESQDCHVSGAYISPSHDDYVLQKRNQNKDMNIHNRLNISNKKLLTNDFIMVDPYEGLICKSSVNFTKIYDRLYKYLKYHFKNYSFKIVFCYGSDNYSFSKVFEANNILSICVNRDENIVVSNNHFTISLNNFVKVSSSELRNKIVFENKNTNKDKIYYLRNDLKELELNTNPTFYFTNIFNKYINNIKIVELKDEKKLNNIDNIISLDFYTKGKYNLNYSRLFNLCDNQIKSIKLIDRIGYINNIDNIDINKEYLLLDDDISSGTTINYIKSNILNNIKIKGFDTIINSSNCYDVNDLRDFVFGSKNGGLTCSLPSREYIRVPYVFPYIDLYNRSSIEHKDIKSFSKDIVLLNLKLFKHYKIKDFDSNFILFLTSQGYKQNQYFRNYLKDLLSLL